jgi:hypothetical protein
VGLLIVVVSVLLTACSSGGSNGEPDPFLATSTTVPGGSTVSTTATTTTASTSSTSTTPSTIASAYASIAALMLTDAPSGFLIQPDRVADTGATNLAKALQDDVSRDAGNVLRGAGFVRGYQRAWVDATGVRQNVVYLYEFATPQGAASYAAHRSATIASLPSRGPVKEFPAFLAGAVGWHSESAVSSFGAVVVPKGVYYVEATSSDGAKVDQSNFAIMLADAQLKRLP